MTEAEESHYGRLWFAARKLVTKAEAAFEARLQAELGIGRTLYLVLSVVQEQPGVVNQRVVAELLGTTPATVSRQLEVGVSSGWLRVDVSPSSRREHEISLTREGEQIVLRGDAIILEESKRLWSGVPLDELISAERTIGTMLASATEAERADVAPISPTPPDRRAAKTRLA